MLILSIILMIIGCDKDNPVAAETESDKLLYQQIVGTWGDGTKSSFHYSADRTWIDSVYYHYSDGTDEFRGVVEGKYQIIDGVLHYSYLHVKNSVSIFSVTGEPAQITIDGNTMKQQNVWVFTPLQQYKPVIYGKWTSTIWFVGQPGSTSPINEGRLMYTYSFNPDSDYFKLQCNTLDLSNNSGYTDNIKYKRTAEYIILEYDDSLKYSFKNDQLYINARYPAKILTKR